MFRSLASSVVRASKTHKFAVNQKFLAAQTAQPFFTQNRFYAAAAGTSAGDNRPAVAVLLHGCGYLDGTEVTEAVSTLIHLSQAGFKVMCFSPDGNQEETYDHATKTVEKNEVRNIASESTRISRVPVRKLNTLKADAYQALIIPGGYGVAKNLSNFAEDPVNFKIEAETERAIKEFIDAKKPIGAICVAPILISKILGTATGGPGCQVTVGKDDKETIDAVGRLGATAVQLDVDQVHVDEQNMIVSTPAYMGKNPQPHEIFEAIGALVEEVKRLSNRGSAEEQESEDMTLMEEIGESMFGKQQWAEMKVRGAYTGESTNANHAKPSGYADEALADFKTIKRVQA